MITPAYRILTPRLELRCWEPSDAPRLKAMIDDNLEHLRPWMPWIHHEPTTLEEKVALLRKFRARFDLDEDFTYAMFARADGCLVGGCGLHPRQGPGALEIGYWVARDRVGRGLATEAAAALTRVAFEVHQVDRVEIRVEPTNVASSTIPRKLGYCLEALLRRRLEARPEGEPRDCEVYTLFAGEPSQVRIELEACGPLGERLI